MESVSDLLRTRFDLMGAATGQLPDLFGSARMTTHGSTHPGHRGNPEVHVTLRFHFSREAVSVVACGDLNRLSFEVDPHIDRATDNPISRYAFQDVHIGAN